MTALASRATTLLWLALAMATLALTAPPSDETNHELLTSLGMVKKRNSLNQHRKRLASESRSSGDDSHMFVIKLPPNPYYYSHLKPQRIANDVNKVPISFKSNGKPAKIYHWNLPALKKIAHARHSSRLSDSKLYNIQKTSPWSDNDVHHGFKPKPKVSFYIPARKTFFHKYFPGNGKPQSFYVIDKSKKPHYHRLLP